MLEIQEAFRKFDKNGDGHITVEELEEARKISGESDDHAKDMITDVDRNGTMLSLKKIIYPICIFIKSILKSLVILAI